MKKILKYILIITLMLALIYASISVLYPAYYKEEVAKYSKKYSLDPLLILAIINTESSFNKLAVSPKSAKGLMQITDATGEWGSQELGIEDYSKEDLFKPDINIQIGAWYFRKLLNTYGDKNTALAAYNAGSGNVSKWLQNDAYSNDGKTLEYIPFSETENYVKKVNQKQKVYKIIYLGKLPSDKDTVFDEFVFSIRKALSNVKEAIR